FILPLRILAALLIGVGLLLLGDAPSFSAKDRHATHHQRRRNAPEQNGDDEPPPADEQSRRRHALDVAQTKPLPARQQAEAPIEQQEKAKPRRHADQPRLPADADANAEYVAEQRRKSAQ